MRSNEASNPIKIVIVVNEFKISLSVSKLSYKYIKTKMYYLSDINEGC